ncbi:MAG: tRNA-binding protein [Novosphingobium sp.]
MTKPETDYSQFAALDIRVGTILRVAPAETRKPTWRMHIDFGPEIGERVSCGAYTNYRAEEMVGKRVIAVVNFPPRRMGPETSEVLVLGVAAPDGNGTIFLTIDKDAPDGSETF